MPPPVAPVPPVPALVAAPEPLPLVLVLPMPLPAVVPEPVPVVLVLLHGRGGSPGDFLNDQWYKELAALGRRAPDLVLVSGGDHSYFHDRGDGPWGRYVLDGTCCAGEGFTLAALGTDPDHATSGSAVWLPDGRVLAMTR